MKILTSEQIREADLHTIKNEPISSVDLMERAVDQVFYWIDSNIKQESFTIFCGVGNNGGDGLVLARFLKETGCNVEVYAVRFSEDSSDDFKVNEERLAKAGIELKDIREGDDFPKIPAECAVVDAIFGTGLSRPIEGFTAKLIKHINQHSRFTIAIDFPSGLFSEDNSGNNYDNIIKADYTLTFEVPKLALLLPENEDYIGHWEVISIGLDKDFIESLPSEYTFVNGHFAAQLLQNRKKFSHKGNYGHALLIGGSQGKIGAVVLSVKAILRSGAGLCSAYIPGCGYQVLQSSVPEAMVITDENSDYITSCPKIESYNAIGVGPGMDTNEQTANALKLIIQNSSIPLVLDADALNIMSENKTWLSFLPAGSILTPHPKEFERLAGKTNNDFERLKTQINFSKKYGVTVVLKGAHTSISCPEGNVFFNSTGNPGMATGGSGDVLTGIITGLCAQGYAPKSAAVLGVFLHGLAGDIAADKYGQEAMIASDITDNLGEAYKVMHKFS